MKEKHKEAFLKTFSRYPTSTAVSIWWIIFGILSVAEGITSLDGAVSAITSVCDPICSSRAKTFRFI